jgi:hypothetical protein
MGGAISSEENRPEPEELDHRGDRSSDSDCRGSNSPDL